MRRALQIHSLEAGSHLFDNIQGSQPPHFRALPFKALFCMKKKKPNLNLLDCILVEQKNCPE